MEMKTYSGHTFDPVNPNPDSIDILDIAVATSRIPRFVGHTAFFYSVAQHQMMTARLARLRKYSVEVQLACLVHDASETYISDIPTPVKRELTNIKEVEGAIQNAIHLHFDILFNSSIYKIVKEMDILAFTYEDIYLRQIPFALDSVLIYANFDDVVVEKKTSDAVALEYMRMFNVLDRERNTDV
jgi:hypothetical protein